MRAVDIADHWIQAYFENVVKNNPGEKVPFATTKIGVDLLISAYVACQGGTYDERRFERMAFDSLWRAKDR